MVYSKRLYCIHSIFLIFIIVICISNPDCACKSLDRSEEILNNYSGELVLLDQNYSLIKKIPKNIFLASAEYNTTVNATLKYDEEKRALHSNKIKGQVGDIFISNLVPSVKTTYHISFSTEGHDKHEIVILGSGLKLSCKLYNNRTGVITSYYYDSSTAEGREDRGKLLYERVYFVPEINNKIKLKITFDGIRRINNICFNDSVYLETPFYQNSRRLLPYITFTQSFIRITGNFEDIYIYDLKQTVNRYFITAIGREDLEPYGLDGPHGPHAVQNGIDLLNRNGFSGTFWFTDANIEINRFNGNSSYYCWLRHQLYNNSWECGNHFQGVSRTGMAEVSFSESVKMMKAEASNVSKELGITPLSWCSMGNYDNITHAIWAYDNLGIYWRNGESGIHGIKQVGNLCDRSWGWWSIISDHGMTYPAFTHETDLEIAIKGSISWGHFNEWVDNYKSNGIRIVPFVYWWKVNANSFEASFSDIKRDKLRCSFRALTNGEDAYVNVNCTELKDPSVIDLDIDQEVPFLCNRDNSLSFWVENGHSYLITAI